MYAINKKKGFSIVHLNTCSYLRRYDEICSEFKYYDIIALTETWLSPLIDDRLARIDGFHMLRQDRNRQCLNGKRKKGGGIVVHINNNLGPYVSLMHEFCENDSNSETLWFYINKPGVKKSIICVLYRPPNGSVPIFVKGLDNTLDTILSKGNPNSKELSIVGDFNIDFSKRNRDINKMKLKELEEKFNIKQIIRTPTRETLRCKSIIDLIFTTIPPDLISSSGTLQNNISDHLPIFIIKKKKREYHPKKSIFVRRMSLYTIDNFGCLLKEDRRWELFWKGNLSLDDRWDIMVNIFTDNLDIICPMKRIRVRSDQPVWFDSELRKAVKDKNDHYKTAAKGWDPTKWEKVKADRKLVRRLIYHKKRNFIMTKLNENANMPKKFWKDIKQNLFFGKDQGTNQLITIKDSNGTTLTGKDAASPLNMYYAQVGPSLATKFTTTWKPLSYLTSLMYLPKMRFRFVTIKELTSIVTCLATSKSSNVEDINTSQLKDAFKTMIIEFTFFINECLSKSVMPQKWKVGTVSPVPKNGNSHAMSDYRPISVLPTPSKIIERAVYNQLIYHFESHGLLDPRQHGFRRDHSTCSAIFELTQYLYNSMDSKLFVSCVFIDYSKAFDTIDHDILYNKLTYYGLDDGVLAWCKDYLHHRKQCVKIDHVRSGEETMKYGVPQGSILGPLFFIIYVNDLLKIIPQNIQILLYADDTVVFFADQDPNTACTNV